jgi:uncharacterized flavoprotein (TIGR03862 family)
MAAEILATAGLSITIYDHMPSVGRKFLMAGRGGLNLTHSQPLDSFTTYYGAAALWLEPLIRSFPPTAVRDWCHGLGQDTFVGTSGRVFPQTLKASPLLRAWLRKLDALGVRFRLKQRWLGWDDHNQLIFSDAGHKISHVPADVTLLALGGASWPRLGSDGHWVEILCKANVSVAPLEPANSGFVVPWSSVFRDKFQGQPLKPVTIGFNGAAPLQGEAMVTAQGLEGGLIYALSSQLRQTIQRNGCAEITLDLRPGLTLDELTTRLSTPRSSQSVTNYLRKFGGLSPVAIGLLYETTTGHNLASKTALELAQHIKSCRVRLTASAPLATAISTAGGIRRDAIDERLMLHEKPGVFVAGEMLDWEAPTGGYLLQATFSTAVKAANGMIDYLRHNNMDANAKV